MAWRLARSLVQLRDEVNRLAPNRSRVSDGTIGDPAHASRASRHNPNSAGVVCALDLTHDPAGGCDIHALARRIARQPHPNLEYIISTGQVAKRRNGFRWEPYTGTNPHTKHAHFAVGVGPDYDPRPPYDDTTPWLATAAPEPPEDDLTPEQDKMLRDVHAVLTAADDPKALLPVVSAARDNTNRLRRMLRLVAARVGVNPVDLEAAEK